MTLVLEKLEEKLKELLELIDNLESENRSYRSLIAGNSSEMTKDQVIDELEKMRLEKEKLERKMELVKKSLERVLGELDRLKF